MIFITRELYKEWKNKGKDIFKEINNMSKRSNVLFPDEAKLLNDSNILNMILELEMKDFLLDVRDSYYFDTEGFIYKATKRLLDFTAFIEKRENVKSDYAVLSVDKTLIPLLVTAIYDIAVFNCWNDHRTLYDLIYYLDDTCTPSVKNTIGPELNFCNMALWVDTCYRHARDYNPAKRKIIRIVNIQNDHSRIVSLEDIYELAKTIYEKI